KDDAVGAGQQVALARFQLLVLGVVEMPQQDLVGQSQWSLQSAAYHGDVARHRSIDCSRHFRGRFDSNHYSAFLAITSTVCANMRGNLQTDHARTAGNRPGNLTLAPVRGSFRARWQSLLPTRGQPEIGSKR